MLTGTAARCYLLTGLARRCSDQALPGTASTGSLGPSRAKLDRDWIVWQSPAESVCVNTSTGLTTLTHTFFTGTRRGFGDSKAAAFY